MWYTLNTPRLIPLENWAYAKITFFDMRNMYYVFTTAGSVVSHMTPYKLGLLLNANDICRWEARQNVWCIRTLFDIHRGSESTLINILYENSLWSTNSQRIALCCLPNVCRTVECCLPCLSNTSTLQDSFVFTFYSCLGVTGYIITAQNGKATFQ